MNAEILITILSTLSASGILLAICNKFFGRKKEKSDIENANIKNAMSLVDRALKQSNDVARSLQRAQSEIDKLRKENARCCLYTTQLKLRLAAHGISCDDLDIPEEK
jgi:hypothetical protein